MAKKIKFIIYIAGSTAGNKGTAQAFTEACKRSLPKSGFDISVEDILKSSENAEEHQILAIPSILRLKPNPQKRIIGEFKTPEQAQEALAYLINDLES